MEKYLSEDEKELHSLIRYHRTQFQKAKIRQGGLHPVDIEIVDRLDKAEKLVYAIAQDRIIIKEKITKSVLTTCPECEIKKLRVPVGEEKSEYGYMCNLYRCDKCNIEYLDYAPNNGKDQLAWAEEFIASLEKNKKKLKDVPDELKKDIEALKKQCEVLRNACAAEEESYLNYQKSIKKQAEIMAQYRDYFLAAKIKKTWPDFPGTA